METLIGLVLPYVSMVLFIAGASYRLIKWFTAPKVLNWKLYPAPHGILDETQYILTEWVSFKTLFRNNRAIWFGSYGFHLALVALFVWFALFLLGFPFPWVGYLGLFLMLGSSLYLLLVRIFIPQMRHVSSFVEYFHLAVFVLISLTAAMLIGEGLSTHARTYYLSLLSLRPVAPPSDFVFLLNLFFLEFVLAYLPFSKMFHMASKYFTYHKLRWRNPYEGAGVYRGT